MENSSFLELPGLTLRIRHTIDEKRILNFAYLKMSADKDLLKEIELLLNSVYSFFFCGLTIPQAYIVSGNVPSAPSPFFKSLEAVYCKDNLVELMELVKNYLTDLRINYAKDLLEHTSFIISVISEKVGYDQYFYFSKIFKKYTSLSPTQYRESVQQKRKE